MDLKGSIQSFRVLLLCLVFGGLLEMNGSIQGDPEGYVLNTGFKKKILGAL
jgi:hypothetical protein